MSEVGRRIESPMRPMLTSPRSRSVRLPAHRSNTVVTDAGSYYGPIPIVVLASAPMTRTVAEVRRVSEHLHYEVEMLAYTATRLADAKKLPEAEVNALLESFTVHARALVFFFYEPPKFDNDVVADHFMPPLLEWSRIAGPLPIALMDVRSRVGTEIAHLSYARLKVMPDAKLWNISEITVALLGAVDLFTQYAENLAPPWATREASPKPRTPIVPTTATGTSSPITVNSISAQRIIRDE